MTEQTSQKSSILNSLRGNPWMVSTALLGVLFLVALFFATSPGGYSGSVMSESVVSSKVIAALNEQTGGGVTLSSISREGSLYMLTVNYNGDSVPVYATLDGSRLALQVIPLDGSAPAPSNSDTPTNNEPVVIDMAKIANAPVRGNANAPVTIVEFSDYECPFCERGYQTLKQVESEYVESGKVKIVYMDFPLSFHPEAEPAARAARCFEKVKGGSDDAYFMYHDKLFDNQASLGEANYKQWARDLGANGAQFDTCFDSNEFADEVAADQAYGTSLGVSGTPGFFINGVELVGAQPFSAFKQVIDAELAKVGA